MLVVDSEGKLKKLIYKVIMKAGRKDYLLSVRKQNVGLPAKEIIYIYILWLSKSNRYGK